MGGKQQISGRPVNARKQSVRRRPSRNSWEISGRIAGDICSVHQQASGMPAKARKGKQEASGKQVGGMHDVSRRNRARGKQAIMGNSAGPEVIVRSTKACCGQAVHHGSLLAVVVSWSYV